MRDTSRHRVDFRVVEHNKPRLRSLFISAAGAPVPPVLTNINLGLGGTYGTGASMNELNPLCAPQGVRHLPRAPQAAHATRSEMRPQPHGNLATPSGQPDELAPDRSHDRRSLEH